MGPRDYPRGRPFGLRRYVSPANRYGVRDLETGFLYSIRRSAGLLPRPGRSFDVNDRYSGGEQFHLDTRTGGPVSRE